MATIEEMQTASNLGMWKLISACLLVFNLVQCYV